MEDRRKDFGRRGESFAAAYFLQKGFHIVARNWSCRFGEIDLIVEREGVIHFVEVKTRHSLNYGYPEEAITKKKLDHLAKAIEWFLRTGECSRYQVDALAVVKKQDGSLDVEWIQNIL
ncbi:MAG TPA: YraN family protein [Patescibacteria group bacterium]|nr:YraN family protein [Patescibacteria group bacterium]